jgi:hypothetical protein
MEAKFIRSCLNSNRNALSVSTNYAMLLQGECRYFSSQRQAIFTHGNRRFCDYGAYLMIFYLKLCFERWPTIFWMKGCWIICCGTYFLSLHAGPSWYIFANPPHFDQIDMLYGDRRTTQNRIGFVGVDSYPAVNGLKTEDVQINVRLDIGLGRAPYCICICTVSTHIKVHAELELKVHLF